MAWAKLWVLTLIAVVASFQPPPVSGISLAQTSLDELLSYQCGRSVAMLVRSEDQLGPLFADGVLLFTSLEAADGSQLLLVNGGYGNYQIFLPEKSINRLRFTIPSTPKGERKTYYLSYMHGHNQRSRYFEYAESRAPAGHEDREYRPMRAERAENLVPHLDYAIHTTAETTLRAMMAGRIPNRSWLHHKVESCDHISRQSPSLARNLHENIDQLETLLLGPKPDIGMQTGSNRVPASL